ncbi:putative ankyrin repeat protein RF_0381 [Pectinophora gossypiella]|uniref:putative ankyrin repeat protein RF_0381 n=1 Tax=Pectinophora gossypiella TaxID=13191 RepID=UPI00214EC1C1|nr:putative ankyrin repeat protein RF_0381 [Pectinophora gossypiella]
MKKNQWLQILKSIDDEEVDVNNIISKLKLDLLRTNSDIHKEWENEEFNIDYWFDVQHTYETDRTTIFNMAAKWNFKKIFNAFLALDADLNKTDAFGCSPLIVAIKKENGEIVEALLNKNCDVNTVNNAKETALHWAARLGFVDITETLINKGAKVNAVDENGSPALHWASDEGYLDVVKVLIKHKADPHIKNATQDNAVDIAAHKGHLNVVKYLVEEAKVDCMNTDDIEFTALHWAVVGRHFDIVKYLVEDQKVNVGANNKIPLHYAVIDIDIFKYLAKYSDILATDDKGNNVLHVAANCDCLDVVKYLVEEKNYDVNQTNNAGLTSVLIAASSNSLDVMKYFAESKKII